jgi:dTDP-4-dehydrorhamnose 3,5-epimerase-like enzyme
MHKTSVDFHEDDRAQRLFDVFGLLPGQINISHVNSTDHVVAWHRHKIQTDYWFCVKGSFKVGLAVPAGDDYEVKWEYISDKSPKVLTIPPGVYHGYKALQPGSTILYYLTEKYDPADEWKVRVGYFGETWETENK